MKKYITIILIFLSWSSSFAQSNIEFNGYLQNMQTVWAPNNQSWIFSNTISNRFNFTWYAKNNLVLRSSLRNIFDYGQFVGLVPFYSEFATRDIGYFDLTEEVTSNNSYVLYSNIDRLNLIYTIDKLEIQIGRQRINWGVNSVWTPNDIFNSSSFINFDYMEKPGSDALRILYYLGFASSVEVVSKLDYKNDLTFASKLQFNKWEYDFQILGGFSESDYILGAGWSGNINTAGFTGELTYFGNRDNNLADKQILVSSFGINYMFANSLFISADFLFNSDGKVGKAQSVNNLFNLDYSAKNLSPSKYSVFSQIQYPITPLTNASLATIFNPTDGSFFLSPSVEFSLNEDVYLFVSGQIFIGETLSEWGDYGQFYYFRLKWNF